MYVTPMKCLILLVLSVGAFAGDQVDTKLGTTEANPATSCAEIYELNPESRGTIGHYYIKSCEGPKRVVCNMKLKCGGIEGGWMEVADVDMNRDDTCPGSWQYIINPRKLCKCGAQSEEGGIKVSSGVVSHPAEPGASTCE